MGRRRAHPPLNIFINNRLAGRLLKQSSGAIEFRYDQSWLDWEHGFPISLSLPLRESPYTGDSVIAVFDNLLPDNAAVRRRVAERTGAQGSDAYSLLERIGRDCVGAMQFLPDDVALDGIQPVDGEPISDAGIEQMLANLAQAPLGIDMEHAFRISVAGAQEKTALLFHGGEWLRPLGTTPTTHILKPQLGEIPTAFGMIDMADSVENEHYCLKLLEGFGLPVAKTQIATFGARKVLAVERFDRRWRSPTELLRLPQEDFCQALGIPSARKYQSHGGPDAVAILKLLGSSDNPLEDQTAFLKSQIIFWLIGATDGHAKNFSVFLRPGGRFGLTPLYDVLTAQPAFDARQIPNNKYKLAMSAGNSRKYQILNLNGRHFVETAKEAGLGATLIDRALRDVMLMAERAPEQALSMMPDGLAVATHTSIMNIMGVRLRSLELGLAEI
jgi:serine/threonine-protein kinase HipA